MEKIIDSKKIKGKLHYLIRWKGYNADNDTWEPEKTVSCPELITKYKDEVCSKVVLYIGVFLNKAVSIDQILM